MSSWSGRGAAVVGGIVVALALLIAPAAAQEADPTTSTTPVETTAPPDTTAVTTTVQLSAPTSVSTTVPTGVLGAQESNPADEAELAATGLDAGVLLGASVAFLGLGVTAIRAGRRRDT